MLFKTPELPKFIKRNVSLQSNLLQKRIAKDKAACFNSTPQGLNYNPWYFSHNTLQYTYAFLSLLPAPATLVFQLLETTVTILGTTY